MTTELTFFNKGAEKMLGYTAAEVVGIHTPKLFHTKEEVGKREKEAKTMATEDAVKKHEIFAANKMEPKNLFIIFLL